MANATRPEYRQDPLTSQQPWCVASASNVEFLDVLDQVYPLKADIVKLQKYCDDNLNSLGSPMSFRAAAPWVLMQVSSYPKVEEERQKVWFSQHELAFGFPVEWYEPKDGSPNGTPVFRDWAMFYPFIYVDSPLSIYGGREIYGWSKAPISIHRDPPTFEPNQPHSIVTIRRRRYSLKSGPDYIELRHQPKPGAMADEEPFLHIQQRRPFLSGRSMVSDLLGALPKAITAWSAATTTLLETMTGIITGGEPGRDLGSLLSLLSRVLGHAIEYAPIAAGAIRPPGTQPPVGSKLFPIVTLKQFREAEDPDQAYFQAIVASFMKIQKVKDAGFLFDPLMPDLSGGIEISLLQSDEEPIVQQLGISRTRTITGEPPSSQPGPTRYYDIFTPVLPYWGKVDLLYGFAEFQYSRTRDSDWKKSAATTPATRPDISTGSAPGTSPDLTTSQALDPAKDRATTLTTAVSSKAALDNPGATAECGAPSATSSGDIQALQGRKHVPYKQGGSGAGLEIPGPFGRDVTMRVFPLAAIPATLQERVDHYLGNTCYGFKVLQAGEYGLVLALVTDCGKLRTLPGKQQPAFQGYGDHEISFAVPVTFFPKTSSGGAQNKKKKNALLPLYMFVGTDWNMVTQFEEFGRIALKSRFNLPSDRWLVSISPHQSHTVLTMSTSIFAGTPGEQQARDCDLIRIRTLTQTTPPSGEPASATEVLKALGLQDYITHQRDNLNWFYTIGLKQVRNPHNHQDADYLSLQSMITCYVVKQRDVEPNLEIAVKLYPSFNLVEALGLWQPAAKDEDGYQALELCRPEVVTLNGIVVENCAHDLCACEDDENWHEVFNPWSVDASHVSHQQHGVLQFYLQVSSSQSGGTTRLNL